MEFSLFISSRRIEIGLPSSHLLAQMQDSQSGIAAKFYALCGCFGEEYIESRAIGVLECEAKERQQKSSPVSGMTET